MAYESFEEVLCPVCSTPYRWSPARGGKKIRCWKCGQLLLMPASPDELCVPVSQEEPDGLRGRPRPAPHSRYSATGARRAPPPPPSGQPLGPPGTAAGMPCPACGVPVPAGSNFCVNCGHDMRAAAGTPGAAQPPAPPPDDVPMAILMEDDEAPAPAPQPAPQAPAPPPQPAEQAEEPRAPTEAADVPTGPAPPAPSGAVEEPTAPAPQEPPPAEAAAPPEGHEQAKETQAPAGAGDATLASEPPAPAEAPERQAGPAPTEAPTAPSEDGQQAEETPTQPGPGDQDASAELSIEALSDRPEPTLDLGSPDEEPVVEAPQRAEEPASTEFSLAEPPGTPEPSVQLVQPEALAPGPAPPPVPPPAPQQPGQPSSPAAAPTEVVCPSCGAAAAPGTVLCVNCGWNTKTGTHVHGARVPSPPPLPPAGLGASEAPPLPLPLRDSAGSRPAAPSASAPMPVPLAEAVPMRGRGRGAMAGRAPRAGLLGVLEGILWFLADQRGKLILAAVLLTPILLYSCAIGPNRAKLKRAEGKLRDANLASGLRLQIPWFPITMPEEVGATARTQIRIPRSGARGVVEDAYSGPVSGTYSPDTKKLRLAGELRGEHGSVSWKLKWDGSMTRTTTIFRSGK